MTVAAHRHALAALLVFALLVLAAVLVGHDGQRTGREPVAQPTPNVVSSTIAAGSAESDDRVRPIDLAGTDRVVPAESVVNVKKQFGAHGDGVTDDTDAIQAAISQGLGLSSRTSAIYFPRGTYLITRPLTWQRSTGAWDTGVMLMGQNRDRTVIKLADRQPGFTNPATPKAMIVTGSQNARNALGEGNQAFGNFVFDLTVDAGDGNSGAIGIDYLASNRGAIRNVVLRAGDGSGLTGIALTRKYPGPALIQDVRIKGFATAIKAGNWEYTTTIEGLRLSGQRLAGIENYNNVLSISDLVSSNRGPAIRNGSSTSRDGLITVLDSTLKGSGSTQSAIENAAHLVLRSTTITGYANDVLQAGGAEPVNSAGNWQSSASVTTARRLGRAQAASGIAPEPAPAMPDVDADQWVGAAQYGALPNDNRDDSAGIQRALDSGKAVVYLRPGWYDVTSPLTVPESVRAVVGFNAVITGIYGRFAGSSTQAIFTSSTRAAMPLTFAQVQFRASPSVVDVRRTGGRPVSLVDVHIGGLPFDGGPGKLFLTDVEGGNGWRFAAGQQVWAWQLNAEQTYTKIYNSGRLWVLGIKTEHAGTVVDTGSTGATEIRGGLLYPATAVPSGGVAFVNRGGQEALTFAVSGNSAANTYPVLMQRSSGTTNRLMPTQVPRRAGSGSVVLSYTD